VSLPPGVSAPPPDPIQAEFAARRPPAGDRIRVDLVAGEIPDLSAWRVLLSSGPGWSIRQRGAQRCLCVGDPAAVPPAGLVALWDADASRATVHCGPQYFSGRPDGVQVRHLAGYPVDQLLLIYYLARRQGLLVHAGGLVAEGQAIILPGVSGAGKSTLARQFLARHGSRLLSDDRIIVRRMDGINHAFGTPWPGDAQIAVNESAPLAAILFPARGAGMCIRELSPQNALHRLLPATSILWHEQELFSSQLAFCERLLRDVPAFELAWSPKTGVAGQVLEFVGKL
jgi:hypothetical protein